MFIIYLQGSNGKRVDPESLSSPMGEGFLSHSNDFVCKGLGSYSNDFVCKGVGSVAYFVILLIIKFSRGRGGVGPTTLSLNTRT